MRSTVRGERHLSLIASLFLPVALTAGGLSCYAANPSTSASTTSQPAAVGSRTSPLIQGNVQKKTIAKTTPRKINFGQNTRKHSSNSFNDISSSMPAAAVREHLARRHELPSAQTAVLRPGGAVGGAAGVTTGAQAPNSTGNSPDILLPNGVAAPETKGAVKNGFYK